MDENKEGRDEADLPAEEPRAEEERQGRKAGKREAGPPSDGTIVDAEEQEARGHQETVPAVMEEVRQRKRMAAEQPQLGERHRARLQSLAPRHVAGHLRVFVGVRPETGPSALEPRVVAREDAESGGEEQNGGRPGLGGSSSGDGR